LLKTIDNGTAVSGLTELWLFRPFAGLPSGSFAPAFFFWFIRPLARSPPGLFAPWLIRLLCLADSPPGAFAQLVRSLACLPSGSFTLDNLPPPLNIQVICY